jgi:hypothetical protein
MLPWDIQLAWTLGSVVFATILVMKFVFESTRKTKTDQDKD